MDKVIKVKPLKGYRLEVTFSDGARGVVSIENRLFGPMFEPLKDPAYFAKVSIDEYGVICWPNGADLAPDALHESLKSGQNVA